MCIYVTLIYSHSHILKRFLYVERGYMMKLFRRGLILLVLTVICSTLTVFAVEPRWTNITAMIPGINYTYDTYSCTVSGVDGTTKISCALVLYEKKLFGGKTEVDRFDDVYYGTKHNFVASYDFNPAKRYILETTASVTTNGYTETATNTYEPS